ncbi:MAG: putative DNA binding domain-containing protein [Deltaproteobacteria bacterium]|nr:putative DNA binding domain-containing protein [Deltaproteobacteria bacterium]
MEDKQSLNEWREAVESVAALATSKGGIVRIGIGPKGENIGVHLGKGTLEDLSNKIKLNTDPPQYPSVLVEGSEKSGIIIISVEESPIKPVWAFGRPMKRVGKTNQHLTREEAQRMQEITTGRTWDALPAESFNLKDVSRQYLLDFQKRTGNVRVPAQMLLKNLSLISTDERPCNGSILLFGRNPQQFFPEAQVKCARFEGKTSVRFLDEMTIEGNLLNQLDNALKFIARNIRLAIHISGRPEREIIPEYPEAAIREAVINAICHRDYSVVGTIQVRIYDDRLEVWNPGTLPPGLTIERLYREHPSLPRNPKIASALYRARLIEHWGTGTLRMANACEMFGIHLEFISESGFFMVRFTKPEKIISQSIEQELNTRQKQALEYIKKTGKITTGEYKRLYNISERQAFDDLRSLLEKGLVVRKGSGRATMYLSIKNGKLRD